jgi:hypothetical protein
LAADQNYGVHVVTGVILGWVVMAVAALLLV